MLKIRLQRVGRKHETAFRLVLTDSENSTKSGRLKEVLGSYDPRKSVDQVKSDRVKYWLEKGAKATGTVHNLLITNNVIEGKKVNVLPKKRPIIKAEEKVEEKKKVEEKTAEAETVEAPIEEPAPGPEPEVVVETPAEVPTEPVVESTEAPIDAPAVADEPAA